MRAKLKRGVYETEYGNSAYVSGPNARTAWDLDARTRVPIEMIDESTWREANDGDEPDFDDEDGEDTTWGEDRW